MKKLIILSVAAAFVGTTMMATEAMARRGGSLKITPKHHQFAAAERAVRPSVAERVLAIMSQDRNKPQKDSIDDLTKREEDILRGVAKDKRTISSQTTRPALNSRSSIIFENNKKNWRRPQTVNGFSKEWWRGARVRQRTFIVVGLICSPDLHYLKDVFPHHFRKPAIGTTAF